MFFGTVFFYLSLFEGSFFSVSFAGRILSSGNVLKLLGEPPQRMC